MSEEEFDPSVLAFFAQLPRQGPGSDAQTQTRLDFVASRLEQVSLVADLGCGTGRVSLALARRFPSAQVIAYDLCEEFLRKLDSDAAAEGLSGQIETRVADMAEPGIAASSLDLFWSEGAAYSIGFERALSLWRELLKPGGIGVVSECEWTGLKAPQAALDFWSAGYPAMTSRAGNLQIVEQEGYRLLDVQALSEQGWQAYYGSIAEGLHSPSGQALSPEFQQALRDEISVYDTSQGSYTYSFYVVQKA